MTIFSASNSFETNVKLLENAIGCSCENVPLQLARLTRGAHHMTVAARTGSFASIALLYYLAHGEESFVIEGERYAELCAFFGPKWNEPGHHTIDYLREPGARVMQKIVNLPPHVISDFWNMRSTLTAEQTAEAVDIAGKAIDLLNYGVFRVAVPDLYEPTGWKTNAWLKEAILLYFKLNESCLMDAIGAYTFDKVPLKFCNWGEAAFQRGGFRVVPGAVVRFGAFIEKDAIIMPSFVNIGAYIGEGTMVDSCVTVGSCAQIGKGVHLSSGVTIGGVLEPVQANPVIVEDGAFIGAGSQVVEGVVVKKGAVLSMGVCIGKNTPIIDDTRNGTVFRGIVPERAVVMMGVHPNGRLTCPHIVKYRDEGTDAATALNEFLRYG